MQVKWVELNSYYTYKTYYPKTDLLFRHNSSEAQNMKYLCVNEKVKRFYEVFKEGNIGFFDIAKFWRFYRYKVCLLKAIEEKYKCIVVRILE